MRYYLYIFTFLILSFSVLAIQPTVDLTKSSSTVTGITIIYQNFTNQTEYWITAEGVLDDVADIKTSWLDNDAGWISTYTDTNATTQCSGANIPLGNGSCIAIPTGGGNSSFNQSLTDSLYYLNSNPNNYINTSNLSGYAQYQFTNNNFNGSGNFTTTATGTFGTAGTVGLNVSGRTLIGGATDDASNALQVQGDFKMKDDALVYFQAENTQTDGRIIFQFGDGSGQTDIRHHGVNYAGEIFAGIDAAGMELIRFNPVAGSVALIETYSSTDLVFATADIERMRLNGTTGNLLIGTTIDDAVSKLQVNGNANISGLINGIDPLTWITSESDPVYSANTYAVDMNQNVGTDDSVSFTSITDGTCTISGGSLSGCTYSETDPVYSANTYATGMNQGVATSDSPDFTGLTVGSVAVLTSESDPVYSANTYAVDMNQNVGTDDSVSFTSITDGTCTITGGSLSGCTETDTVYSANIYATGMNQGVATSDSPDFTGLTVGSVAVLTSESDPVYSANTYAVDMNQNVGTDDTPSFTGLTLPGSGGSWSVYVDVDNSLNFVWS
jgi:hypothetical protein